MACRPLELLAELQVRDWSRTAITYNAYGLGRGPNGMQAPGALAKMHVKDWGQTIITYVTTINLCEKGPSGMQASVDYGKGACQ